MSQTATLVKPDLTQVDAIHEYFNAAASFNDELARYNAILEANGGLRPACLNTRPIRSKHRRRYEGFGELSGW